MTLENAGCYATHAVDYLNAGWAPLPLPTREKAHPPKGWTGRHGKWPEPGDVAMWSLDRPDANIGLRLPPTVLGIDVDDYADRGGLATFRDLIERWGTPPRTVRSSARGLGPSCHLFYRVPPGLHWPGSLGPGIDVIHHGHRYAVAWPSIHPDGGTYQWFDATGTQLTKPPKVDDLPELPPAWVEGILALAERTPEHEPLVDAPHAAWDGMDADQRDRVRSWLDAAVRGKAAELAVVATWPEGHRDQHGRGWQKVIADLALWYGRRARADWTPWDLLDAQALFTRTVPTAIAAAVPLDREWRAQHARMDPAPFPEGLTDKPREIEQPAHELSGPSGAEPPDGYAAAVAAKALELRILDDARARRAAEKAGPLQPFDAGTVGEILARPEVPAWRVQDLIPADAGTLNVAQRKTGKTTFSLNLARCLMTGDDFLGRFPVEKINGNVGFLNFEVSAATLARWADEAGVDKRRMFVVNLRGRRNPFRHPDDLAALARLLREHDVETLGVDPFGRAYPGTSQNDAGEVTAWLATLDAFTRSEVGARDLILTAHAGWNGERSRGSTALEDWADSIVTLTRGAGADEKTRYLRAIGRDVDVDEDALTFDPTTRWLSLTGNGSRARASHEQAVGLAAPAVLAYIVEHPGESGRTIVANVPGTAAVLREALARLVRRGDVVQTPYPKGKGFTYAPTDTGASGASGVRRKSPGGASGASYRKTHPQDPPQALGASDTAGGKRP